MTEDRGVGAVILAAGTSRRFGSPKVLATLAGRTLLEHVIATAQEGGLRPVVVVVPSWLGTASHLEAPRLRRVDNPFPERGMSLSLRLGLGALPRDTSAAVILLGDQPLVGAEMIAAVVGARGDRPLVAAFADGVLAPPVLIERTHFHLADGLSGDIGLRGLLRGDPELVTSVPVPAHVADLDTPDDLGRLSGP